MSKTAKRVCRCGNDTFYALQVCRMNVVVNSNNKWEDDADPDIHDAEPAYGPYTCTQCGAVYYDLKELESLCNSEECKTAVSAEKTNELVISGGLRVLDDETAGHGHWLRSTGCLYFGTDAKTVKEAVEELRKKCSREGMKIDMETAVLRDRNGNVIEKMTESNR